MDKPTGRQIAAARTLAGLSQPELAHRAQISVPTLKRMEASAGLTVGMPNNVDAVCRALEAAGVEFTNGGQPGVRMKGGSSLQRETKSYDDLKAIILKELADLGFPGVSDAQLYKIKDPRVSFNWSIGHVSLGDEDRQPVMNAVRNLESRLQTKYDLIH